MMMVGHSWVTPMPSHSATIPDFAMARLVPELLVTDIRVSMHFWCNLCGFSIAFERLYEGFAYLDLEGAQIMLEERGRNRNWITAPWDAPFGRGINFQTAIRNLDSLVTTLTASNWPLFMEPEEKWYKTGNVETGVRQFLLKDPDGYLIRFSQRLGTRPIT